MLPYFQGQGVGPHNTICPRYVICVLMVVGAVSPWAWTAVHLPVGRVFVVSLLAFVISLSVLCFAILNC
jgi:glucose dehydrogenase